MTARTLAIRCFTTAARRARDEHGLALMFMVWLGIARPTVHVGSDGRYFIHCADRGDARRLCGNFGGTADGLRVTGYVVDLTE